MKKIITSFRPMSRLSISLLFTLPCGMSFCSTVALATEYDQINDQIMTYDTACDASHGCYQVVTSDDKILATSSVGYVIGQDKEGKPIERYSESYIDGQLIFKQETDYSLSQRLLENRTYAGNDQHIIAVKDYDYDVYERTAQEVLKNYEETGKIYQTNILVHHYDEFNSSKETQSELTSDKPGDYKSYATKYDVLGRAISRSYEVNEHQYETSSQYDGADRGVSGNDFNANVNASVYDGNGHLAEMVSYHKSSAPKHNLQTSNDVQVIHYKYDNYSRLIEQSLNGHILGYNFDKVGLETGFSISNTISNRGNLTASENSENITYNAYNRIKTYNDYNNITYTVYYKADGEVDHIDMNSSTSNLSGTLSSDKYEYDSSVPYWLKGQVHTQTIDVNHNGHHQVNLITRGYYAPNEVNDEVNIGKPLYVWYQVSQDGKSTEDLTVEYAYDDQGRVLTESYLNHANPSDTTGDHSENNLNKVINYTYDPLNRLAGSETLFISVNKQTGDLSKQVESYTYNINGDVTKHVTTEVNQDGSQKIINNTYTYNEINQLLTRSESIKEDGQITSQIQYVYGYDKHNGNMVSVDEINDGIIRGLYEYKYNSKNQMEEFKDIQKNQSYVYTYYPNGRRSSKSIGNELKNETNQSIKTKTESIGFLYDHQGNLLNEEYSQDGQLQKRSSYFAGLRFIDDLINKNNSVFQFPLADQHNHPATVSFSQGQSKIESYHLTDYGELEQANSNVNHLEGIETERTQTTESDNQNLINFMMNPKIYGSAYYDPESNLQYMGARYYSADIQRFMAQDSYDLLNRYNYTNGNPVMNYDPDGHKSVLGNVMKVMDKINYGLNGGAIIAGGIALLATPEITAPILFGEVTGVASGTLGIAAQVLSESNVGSSHLKKGLEFTSLGLGLMGIGMVGYTTKYEIIAKNKEENITRAVDLVQSQDTIKQLTTEVSQLNTQVSQLAKNLEHSQGFSQHLLSLKSSNTSIENLNKAKTEINGLTKRIKELQNDITTLHTEKTGLSEKIDNLDRQISELNQQINSQTIKINELSSTETTEAPNMKNIKIFDDYKKPDDRLSLTTPTKRKKQMAEILNQ